MELYFNFQHKIILAKHDGKVYSMQTGEEVDYKLNKSLRSYKSATSSQWIPLPDDEDKFFAALLSIGSNPTYKSGDILRSIEIDGHPIFIDRTRNEVNEPYICMTGQFPRYFWRGLENVLDKLIYK